MTLDYFRLPIFTDQPTLGRDLADIGQIIGEGRARRKREALDRERLDANEAHQRAMEALAGRTADTAEKRQLAAEDFTRRQSAVAEARSRSQDLRDQTTFDQQQADRMRATTADIAKALPVAPTRAQAIAASSQFVDPRTGQMQGVKLEPEPPPPAPGPPPQEPKPPEFVGPLEDPEAARARAIAQVYAPRGEQPTEPPPFDPQTEAKADLAGNDAAAEVNRQQRLRDQYGQDTQAFPAKRAAFDQQQQAHDQAVAEPRYKATFASGQSVEIDPREERKAVLAEAKDKADRLRQGAVGQPPDVARAMLTEAQLIESTISNADKAPITNMAAATEAQGFKASESEKERGLKREVAHSKAIAKAHGAGGGNGAGLAELIRMKEEGQPDSAIAARAAQLGIPAGGKAGWLQSTKEVIRGGAVVDRNNRAKAALEVTGPNGEAGTAKSTVDAKALNAKNEKFAQLKNRAQALIQDVEQNGNRVISPSAIQRRNSLMSSFNAAARVYNGLGGTDASQRMENEISGAAGTPGHGILMGANPDILRHLLNEAEQQHTAGLQIRTRGGGAPAARGVRTLRMPDGSIARFDAEGKRIQ